jgi:WD40-like Beta Propeller Repeat
LRPRDLIVVGAIVLVAGFATADALRGRAEDQVATSTADAVQTGPTRLPGPAPAPEAPADWPSDRLAGTLVFADRNDCRLRELELSAGLERRLALFSGTCDLWAAPAGAHVAYALGPSSADGFVPFKLADLVTPSRELGGYRALFGVVIWSPDGQRVAWCGRRRVGFDLQIGGPARRLPRCPAAYTPEGNIAYALGNKLIVEDRVVHRANGGITYVHYGTDGSLALVLDGKRLERWEGDRPAGSISIPAALQGSTPVMRPDNCAAVVQPLDEPDRVELLDLGCLPEYERATFSGSDAAWSPDGQWIAVAEEHAIAFTRVVGPAATVRWPTEAAELAWRPG